MTGYSVVALTAVHSDGVRVGRLAQQVVAVIGREVRVRKRIKFPVVFRRLATVKVRLDMFYSRGNVKGPSSDRAWCSEDIRFGDNTF